MRTVLGLIIVFGIELVSGVPLAFGQSKVVGCNADEVEIYRDKHKIVCKNRAEYATCIKDAGEQMKRDCGRNCGATYKSCFESRNIDLSITAAGCLAGALACGAGQVACAALCNVIFTAQEWQAYHACSVEVSPCYESALERDKERKERCKE